MSELIKVTMGARAPKEGVTLYFGEESNEGFIYVDMETFNNPTKRNEVCYIADCAFDGRDFLTDDEVAEEIKNGGADTHETLFEGLKTHLIDEFGAEEITDDFVEYCCELCMQNCEWTCLSTYYMAVEWEEDLIAYKNK